MNDVLAVLNGHGTVRDFESDYQLTDEQVPATFARLMAILIMSSR